MRILLVSILFLAVTGGCLWLQAFLSRRDSRWPGLILPVISFALSLMLLCGVLFFSAHTGVMTTSMTGENAVILDRNVTQLSSLPQIIGSAVYLFLLANIPTAVLLIMYAACRGKRNRQRALAKMSAQDLE